MPGAGCAPGQQAVRAPGAGLAPVEDPGRLIAHGCYRCLTSALAAAEALGARDQAFEAAALLVLRSKELGLRACSRTSKIAVPRSSARSACSRS